MATGTIQRTSDFNLLRVSLASPEQILDWSYGEVKKPETLNYRTFKPDKDGLFCERIFGPVKDWECSCGKYKKIRNKNVVCEKCGVLVTRARVRRQRMGHIRLAAPVAHAWYARGASSRLGLLTGIAQADLEKVIYFAQYVVTEVDEEKRTETLKALQSDLETELKQIDELVQQLPKADPKQVDAELVKRQEWCERYGLNPQLEKAWSNVEKLAFILTHVYRTHREEEAKKSIKELQALKPADLITEPRYRELRRSYGNTFSAAMGAEALLTILQNMNMKDEVDRLREEIARTTGQRHKRLVKRLKIARALLESKVRPEWMLIKVLPVLPPDLRPMVRMGGVRFASSSLNDLYRRVVSRNNRLAYLIKIQAPEIMIRNEKRMLQESVDALIDTPRRTSSGSQAKSRNLKPLTDLLRGKQGRFRQNLLGKRTDYSGRAVIVPGPELAMGECGLPRYMAMELFKPFVIKALIEQGHAQNIKNAKRLIESDVPVIWDLLEEVTKGHPILLNRAPTLHRLGIQAFYPTLIDGSAIRLHPLVCTAFNADFDGDQMAVHVPLTEQAQAEARTIMLSKNNLLAPRAGAPIVLPTLDMILGLYYLTSTDNAVIPKEGEEQIFADFNDVRLAYETGRLPLREIVIVRNGEKSVNGDKGDKRQEGVRTTAGRVIFNQVVLDESVADGKLIPLRIYDRPYDRFQIEQLVNDCHDLLGTDLVADMLDRIKSLGFEYATKSGTTISIFDLTVPEDKPTLISTADRRIDELDSKYRMGLITEDEKRDSSIQIWLEVSDELTKRVEDRIPSYGGVYFMSRSGAKGNIAQIKQMVGMRGLMADPKGRIIEMPIRSSFREGLSVYEYFISTHGARKGLADTALRTADSGYLTRRLVDVAQDVIIMAEDCGTFDGFSLSGIYSQAVTVPLAERIVSRYLAEPIAHPETGEVIVDTDTVIDRGIAKSIEEMGIKEIKVRSPLGCTLRKGICAKCYGYSLASNSPAITGEAMGIIAAQSIGEPGTQLTMRTFHTGGIVSRDITAGLPRVVEIFEARTPKGKAVLTEIGGKVEFENTEEGVHAVVSNVNSGSKQIVVPETHKVAVKNGQKVHTGDVLLTVKKSALTGDQKDELVDIVTDISGTMSVSKSGVAINWTSQEVAKYQIPADAIRVVSSGDTVEAGQPLTTGPSDPNQILKINGYNAVQNNITSEIQAVYRSQGVSIHDKHVEVVLRQMLRKVRIAYPGDTDYTAEDVVDKIDYENANNKIIAAGGTPARAEPILMGVTRASLSTSSFLSAASFQETSRVLTDAALWGAKDVLKGLKENVIIGRLVPARLDQTDAGKHRLDWQQLEEKLEQIQQSSEARKMAEYDRVEKGEHAHRELSEPDLDAPIIDEAPLGYDGGYESDEIEVGAGEEALKVQDVIIEEEGADHHDHPHDPPIEEKTNGHEVSGLEDDGDGGFDEGH